MKFDDKVTEFPNKTIHFILTKLKGTVMFTFSKLLSLIPSEYVIDDINKLESSELRKQYLAVERGIERWVKDSERSRQGKFIGKDGRGLDCLHLIKKVYFTVIKHEANYLKLSAIIADEYNKVRQNGECTR